MAVQAYSTHDILLNLFKLSLKDRNLPEIADESVVALEAKIARSDQLIQTSLENSPLKAVGAVKALLMQAKDTPRRKELVQNITELDTKLITQNAQGESLKEESKKIINQYWDLVVTAGLKNEALKPSTLEKVKNDLNNLETKTKPYEEKHEQFHETVTQLGKQVEAIAGKSLAEVTQQPSSSAEPKP